MKQPKPFFGIFYKTVGIMRFSLCLSLVLMLGACAKNNDAPNHLEKSITGKWQLFSSTSVWDNVTTLQSDLPWQEIYVFKNDSTFVKTKEQDGTLDEAEGIYFKENPKNGDAVYVLEYNVENEIISSCSNRTEYFKFSDEYLVNNSWAPCDGPILNYVISEEQ